MGKFDIEDILVQTLTEEINKQILKDIMSLNHRRIKINSILDKIKKMKNYD